MYDLTNHPAHRSVLLAQQEAFALGHDQIGTEHLLLALLRRGTGAGHSVLASLGVTSQRAHEAADRLIGQGPTRWQARARARAGRAVIVPLTVRAEWILTRARLEAKNTEHDSIHAEHILLALLREDGGGATKILDDLKLNRDEARRRLLVMLRVLPYPGPTVADGFVGDLETRIAAVRAAKDEAIDNREFSLAVDLRQVERTLLTKSRAAAPKTA
jgi:ATP-dependent Clp protease ATP-binding subunit ClpA